MVNSGAVEKSRSDVVRRSGATWKKARGILLPIAMWIAALLILIPFYYVVVNTIKPAGEAVASPMALPRQVDFSSYAKAWQDMNYPLVFMNTLINTVVTVVFVILISSMAAYTLMRRRNLLNKILYNFFVSAFMIPYVMMILPLFKIIRDLHMMNSMQGVILIYVATSIPFQIFLYCSFIKTIPPEIEEAAIVDGASVFRIFRSIYFPLLKSVSSTVAILVSINVWNDFITQLLFIQSPQFYTITRMLYTNVGQFRTDWTALMPMFVLGIAPVLIFYLVMQKHIVKGIAMGSVKG